MDNVSLTWLLGVIGGVITIVVFYNNIKKNNVAEANRQGRLEAKIDNIAEKVNSTEEKLVRMEEKYDLYNDRTTVVEENVKSLKHRVDKIEKILEER